jgi:lipopolysaccharide transport system ATP-binding protein
MTQPAIRVEGLGKKYQITHETRGRYKTLRESVMDAATAPYRWMKGERGRTQEEFWALKDVSFEVQPGEVVGIIGRNGAGKSTLLKILSRITKPTNGRVELNGRVGSLLEVGTGFHPELTGRENVYLNGSILGMTRREIDKKFDEIVAFAEVEKFLDTPVKRYSSGMYVRLAFAVAAHLEPEILIVDEVLAVGDQAFQKKCVDKMRQCASAGRTVFVVSHQMTSVRDLCSRVVWLDRGRVKGVGAAHRLIDEYLRDSNAVTAVGSQIDLRTASRTGNGSIQFETLSFHGKDMHCAPVSDGPLHIELRVRVFRPTSGSVRFEIQLLDRFQTALVRMNTLEFSTPLRIEQGDAKLHFAIASLHLAPGSYSIALVAGDAEDYFDVVSDAASIEVVPSPSQAVNWWSQQTLVTRRFEYYLQSAPVNLKVSMNA